jgi:oligopeptide/dipeptide ABC transporter ATP-binding protein
MESPLLEVIDLKTYFFTLEGVVKAVDEVSFTVKKGEVFGIVGESGSGKTMTSLSILRLIPPPSGKIIAGKILFKGEDLLKKSFKEMRSYRGSRISMVTQDPMTSLNPVYRVGNQIMEAIAYHQGIKGRDLLGKALEMMRLVHIPSSEVRVKEYPYQFSGGMRQRAMIAMALSCQPDLLIADEPTTALDVTIQAQILRLMKEVQGVLGTAIIFITHDLGIVANMCDRVAVMYAGKIVEQADVRTIFHSSRHPYTRGLMNSIPKLRETRERLQAIEGQPPDLGKLPQGCDFSPRCPSALPRCHQEKPGTETVSKNHEIRCFRWREE